MYLRVVVEQGSSLKPSAHKLMVKQCSDPAPLFGSPVHHFAIPVKSVGPLENKTPSLRQRHCPSSAESVPPMNHRLPSDIISYFKSILDHF